jgi:hypothetical protein
MRILGKNMTDDDVVYIKHCIKNFSGPAAFMWLESHLKGDQINEVNILYIVDY